jgi:hypothetical protein
MIRVYGLAIIIICDIDVFLPGASGGSIDFNARIVRFELKVLFYNSLFLFFLFPSWGGA